MPSPLSSPRLTPRRSSHASDISAGTSMERDSLRAYMDDSDCVIEHTMQHYKKFVRQCYDGSVNQLFRRVGEDHGMYLYEEKYETTSISSFVHQIWPGGRRKRRTSTSSDEGSDKGLPSFTRQTKLHAFGGGEVKGTLDDVMAGVYAATTDDHAVNCAVQFGLENVVDSGIMETFEEADDANPCRYFGVKWVEVARQTEARKSEDSTLREPESIDELCWIERTGFQTTKSGRRFGYHLMKTVDSDYTMDDPTYRSIQMSACYLYNQVENGVVHVFVRGIVEVPHIPHSDMDAVLSHASAMLLAPTRPRQCQRMKMITKMIDRSKAERTTLTVCRCSTVIPDLPRVGLCSNCRESMQEFKLLSVSQAAARKRELFDKSRFSGASTSSLCSDRSSWMSSLSQPSSPPNLQSRRGSIRRDGEIPDEIDPDVLSYRMLLPIREARDTSAYREKKKRSGNVLLKMLLKHEEHRRSLAADSLAPGDS